MEAIERISKDFEQGNPPFDDVTFPEERLLSEVADRLGSDNKTASLSMEDRASLVSAFATFDYNRSASQLVGNLLELFESNPRWFDARHVPNSEKEAEYLFKEIGFRYPRRDAHAWVTNCQILRNTYHGRWTELLLSVESDAVKLVERLEEDDFLCIKGDKIAPMYARIIDDDVAPLSSVWDLNIAVDVHIARLSRDLFDDPDMSKDTIREEWRGLAIEEDINRAIVDQALWMVGNQWNNWGEDYWQELSE